MHINSRVVGLSLCAALSLSALTGPIASADAELNGGVVKINRADETGSAGYINGTVRPDGKAQLAYTHPESAIDPKEFSIDSNVQIDAHSFEYDSTAQPVVVRDGETDVITYVQEGNGVRVERAYRIVRNEVEVTVTVTNIGDALADVSVESANSPGGDGYPSGENGYRVRSEGYELTYHFDGARPQSRDSVVRASWSKPLAVGESLTAKTIVIALTNEMALDSDQDGFRDEWERNGIVLSDGRRIPIHRWGADPDRKDLFLQVNWMQSEWESLGCADVDRFAATAEDFTKFVRCATANTKSYEPEISMLREMEDLFAKNGITLHIDAGTSYASPSLKMSDAERRGGMLAYKPGQKIMSYTPGFFDEVGYKDEDLSARLDDQANELLGERRTVFRSALIGTRLYSSGDDMNVTGLGQVHGSAFFVAADPMTQRDQLRGTLLHEFGHTLGLKHWGRETPENTVTTAISNGYDHLEGYQSAMSYAHQFSIFDFAGTQTDIQGETIPHPRDNSKAKPIWQKIDYKIPADWSNLNLDNGIIGSGVLKQADEPQDAPPVDVVDQEDADAEELALAVAAAYNGKAGFRLAKGAGFDNGIITKAGENVLRGQLYNLGETDDTFTVIADYGMEPFRESYYIPKASGRIFWAPVNIDITPAALLKKAVVPVEVTVLNSAGQTVYHDNFNVSALDYTPKEAAKVLDEILTSDAPEDVKRFAREKLAPIAETSEAPAGPRPNPEIQKPSVTTDTTGANTGTGETPGSSASPASIGIAVTLAVLALAGAGFGWALNQGLITLPF